MDKREILEKIKQSSKYKAISEKVIVEEIEKYLKRNQDYELYKDKKILSEVKAGLHKIHGSFQKNSKAKREKYLEDLKDNPTNLKVIRKILLTNRATKERIEEYEEIYKSIFYITGKPKTIVDLGCGLNPLSFVFMELDHRSVSYPKGTRTSSRPKLRNAGSKINYYAYDIDEEEISFVNRYFSLEKISGKAEILNLSTANENEIKKIPKSDVCFMFKLVDVLDIENHKQSEKIIENINSNFIVVSFSTKTLSGKKMNFPERNWFGRMLMRVGKSFRKLEFENEVFYVIDKRENL